MDLQFSPVTPRPRVLLLTQPSSRDVSEMIHRVNACVVSVKIWSLIRISFTEKDCVVYNTAINSLKRRMRVNLLLCVAIYTTPKHVLPRHAQTCVTWSHACLDTHKSNYVCVLPVQRPDQFKTQTILSFFVGGHLHMLIICPGDL